MTTAPHNADDLAESAKLIADVANLVAEYDKELSRAEAAEAEVARPKEKLNV